MKSKQQVPNNEISQAGSRMTGDQLATILQTIKEGSVVGNKIEFTPTITIDTIENYIERILDSESIKKVQFGVINVVSERKAKQVHDLAHQENEIPGEHWVSYIQVPNLFDAEGKVTGVISILLNSAGEIYGTTLNEIKHKIEKIFEKHAIQITLPIKHLGYQQLDLEKYQDWNTCGIWTCYFFEQTIEKIIKVEDPSEINFTTLINYLDIGAKRREYADWLNVIDQSTNPVIIDSELSGSQKDNIIFDHDIYRKARATNDIPTQLNLMQELALTYRSRTTIHDHAEELAHAKASGIFNYCINLCKDKDGNIKEEFRERVIFFNEQLLEIENGYLLSISKQQKDLSIIQDEILQYKASLKEIRDFARNKLNTINTDYHVVYTETGERSEDVKRMEHEKSEQIKSLFSEITERMRDLVSNMT